MYLNEFDYNSKSLKWKLIICVIKGHQGCFNDFTENGITEESYHCYRCGATWIKNDPRERIKFYAV